MNFIIQDLLDFAQIKGDKFRKNNLVFNIKDAIEKVMSIQRQKAKDKNLEFDAAFINIGNEEEGQESPMICCDEHRIMQVLLGLQTNALKFTKRGRVQTNVEIITEDSQKYLKISVIDTGIGIPEKNQNKLFKLFGFVQDSQNLNINGIGLGLMISKQIVKKFDGNVNFISEEGCGSTFCFTFKL